MSQAEVAQSQRSSYQWKRDFSLVGRAETSWYGLYSPRDGRALAAGIRRRGIGLGRS